MGEQSAALEQAVAGLVADGGQIESSEADSVVVSVRNHVPRSLQFAYAGLILACIVVAFLGFWPAGFFAVIVAIWWWMQWIRTDRWRLSVDGSGAVVKERAK